MSSHPSLTPTNDKQSSSDNSELLRIKSAMVLFALEQALGNFVRKEKKEVNDLPDRQLRKIRQRENKRGTSLNASNASTTADVIAATYFREVFGMAEYAAEGLPEEEDLNRLRNLFEMFDAFDIRNACFHANTSFHPCYWYRIAAIATDPVIEKLRFDLVTKAFRHAEGGRLDLPPEEWLNKPIWSLPNNLPQPQQFEHGITGLIGRENEIAELKENMKNERLNSLIALVAPGGLGKTALLLEALEETALSPDSTKWVDRILYFSSKTEVLTADGIVTQIPPATDIEGLCEAIAITLAEEEALNDLLFEEVCEKFAQERILLCLDNLETILLDNPKAFDRFYRTLPPKWRVIVTSRVSVNPGYTMPLPPLSEEGALELAKRYLLKSGGNPISEEQLKNLVQYCNSNPLAIRLSIDGYIAGKELTPSRKSARDNVLEFSYTNLIETLSPAAKEVLECLYATSEPLSRARAVNLLQQSADKIAEAFIQLCRTSLVTRIQESSEELYTLGGAIRELLLRKPINLEVRQSVVENLRKTKRSVSENRKQQRNRNTSPLSEMFIPNSTPDQVRVIAANALRQWSRSSSDWDNLNKNLDQVNQAIEVHKDQAVLYRVRGLILLKLLTRVDGKDALRQAWDMQDLPSGLVLSSELRTDQDYQEAAAVAEELVLQGWDDPNRSDVSFARKVVQNYFLPLIWDGKTEKVIEKTNNWQNTGELRPTFASLRAQALRQSVEHERNFEKTQDVLCAAIDVLSETFAKDGYVGIVVAEGMKLLEQLDYQLRSEREISKEAKLKYSTFVEKHLSQMCRVHKTLKQDHPSVRQWVENLSVLSIKNDKNSSLDVLNKKLTKVTQTVKLDGDKQTEDNWILVNVKPRKLSKNGKYPPSLFATDTNNQDYYVHRQCLDSAEQIWDKIQESDFLEVLADEPIEGKSRPVRRARWIVSNGELE